ncbi:MAG: 2Fe-2S iron-sulfur cluster-binding protein [Methylococcales bacterium]
MKNSKERLINTTINGKSITAPEHYSVIQALWYSGYPRIKSVGCLGGVCGSCRVMVRRRDDNQVTTELGCEVLVEDGMQVNFLAFPIPIQQHYKLESIRNSWEVQACFHDIFPEADNCRHCGGCNETCPKGIDVERGVVLASKGRFKETSDLFTECVLCDLCQSACPESISPNYVGIFSRRITAHLHIRPSNLINRLERLRKGELQVIT